MKRLLVIFTLLAAVVMPLSVMAQSPDTIVIRGFGNIVTFNPHMTTDGASYQPTRCSSPRRF